MLNAEVAEWQTRRSQKPLGLARVGSTPTFGTIVGLGREWRMARVGCVGEQRFARMECDGAACARNGEDWCRGADSNRRHMDFQSIALPTELPRPGVGNSNDYDSKRWLPPILL